MRVLTAVIAIAVGILVFIGYFLPSIQWFQVTLLNWALIMTAFAAIMGVLNLVFVHTSKIRLREKGNLYSAVLIIFLIGTFLFGMVFPPDHDVSHLALNGVIIPVEAALMGILTITLVYAAIRLLRRRPDFMSITFLATAVLILLGSVTLPFGQNVPIITDISLWVKQTLAVGGARGILIGVALGTLTTGLRVLFGIDRPYGGQ
jgi:hypothetical protein